MSLEPLATRRRPRLGRVALRLAVALILSATTNACADLQPLDAGHCGNGVIEPDRGEDCDGFAVGSASCRPPGSAAECRLDCAAKDSRCPSGMGCGQDGLCRAPSGVFETWGPSVDGSMLRLLAGDFDGDGRGDLLGVSNAGIAVSYFDPTGIGVKTSRFPSAPTLPAIGDFTEDGIDDIVQPVSAGIGVLQGASDRTLSPLAYSTRIPGNPLLVPMNVDASSPGSEMLALRDSDVFVTRTGEDLTLLATLPHPAADLAPRFAVGAFDEGLACESVALAWKGSTKIELLSPCEAVAQRWSRTVKLADGAQVADDGGVTAYHVDDDEHLDLVVWTKTGGKLGIAVAYGVGDGSFTSAPPSAHAGEADVASAYESISPSAAAPLAVGHLNADGVLDFVNNQGLNISGVTDGVIGYTAILAPLLDAKWDQAVIGDFNGNGIPDVIAASSRTTGLDFYNGAGNGAFAYAKVPTTGAPTHMTPGDFDGDLLTDLAIDEKGSFEVGGDSLSVLFGKPAGPPEEPVSLGRLGLVSQVVAANLPQSTKGSMAADAIADLVVASFADAADTKMRVSLFAGASSRLLESPFFFYTSVGNNGRAVVASKLVTAGHFSGGDAHLDLGVFSRQDPPRLWMLTSTGAGTLTVAGIPDPFDSNVDDKDTHLVSVNLGPTSGVDSVVVLTRWAGGDESGKRSAVLVAHPDGARWSVGAPSFLDVDVADGSSGRAIPCDVDGDGFVDVVVATATKREPIGSAIILWNDGQGALDVEHRTVIPNPDPGEFGRLTSVACLRADRDADGELALLLSNGVFLAKLDRASRKVVSTEQLVEPSGDALEGGIDCVARDIDGDGLDDLAVADAAGIHVYRARPEVQ